MARVGSPAPRSGGSNVSCEGCCRACRSFVNTRKRAGHFSPKGARSGVVCRLLSWSHERRKEEADRGEGAEGVRSQAAFFGDMVGWVVGGVV